MLKSAKVFILILAASLCTVMVNAEGFENSLELLPESSDYQSVQKCGEEICNMVNSLLPDRQSISESDIDWNKVYKIYVDDEDIFSLNNFSKSSIIDNMKYIWSYSDVIDGQAIKATVSRALAPDYSLVTQNIISEEEYDELVNRAGTWCVPEAEIDVRQTPDDIINVLQTAGVSSQDDVILIGGSPKMRTLFAVTFTDGMADKLIPLTNAEVILDQDINVASESQDANTKLSAGTSYSFEEVARVMSNITILEGSTGGGAGNNNPKEIIWPEFTFVIGFTLLLYCCYKIVNLRGKRQRTN